MQSLIQWKELVIDSQYTGYNVSENGDIYSTKTNKILSANINPDGYVCVNLYLQGKNRSMRVHRLVALAFIPNPLNLPEVNHKNGNKMDNTVGNLEWMSHQDNVEHAWRTGLACSKGVGEENPSSVYTEKQILEVISLLLRGISINEISNIVDVDSRTIEAVKYHESWNHLTNDIVFPKYDNGVRTYPEFENVPANYIRDMIRSGYTNNEIMEETKLKPSKKLHTRLNKIRAGRISNIMLHIRDNGPDKNAEEEVKNLRKSQKISKKQHKTWLKNYNNERYFELQSIFENDSANETFIFETEVEEYLRLKKQI